MKTVFKEDRYADMKKKKIFILLISVLSVAFMLLTVFLIWYFTPKIFLKGVLCEDITSVVVFNGNNGCRFVIENDDEIRTVIENVQGISMRRGKISSGYSGSAYHLYFKDHKGETVDFFIINSDTTIRDDPFFYKSLGDDLCFNYLFELEKRYTEMNEANEAAFVKKDSQELDFAATIGRISSFDESSVPTGVAVINSEEELSEYCSLSGDASVSLSLATEYNTEFFEENVLILVTLKESNASVLYRYVEYVGATDEGKLALFIVKHSPVTDISEDTAYWSIRVEARADISDASDVIIYCNSSKIH